jgi:hypothetical protein
MGISLHNTMSFGLPPSDLGGCLRPQIWAAGLFKNFLIIPQKVRIYCNVPGRVIDQRFLIISCSLALGICQLLPASRKKFNPLDIAAVCQKVQYMQFYGIISLYVIFL